MLLNTRESKHYGMKMSAADEMISESILSCRRIDLDRRIICHPGGAAIY
jgi:hypothetical protein